MYTIRKGNVLKKTPFGNMEDLTDVPLRLSSFCIELKVENGFLMCSALTGTMLYLTFEEHKDIESGTFPLNTLIRRLIHEGLIVSSDTDEYTLVDSMRAAAPRRANEISNFVILPTTDCNAQCFYCYEKGLDVSVRLNLGMHNREDVSALLEELESLFSDYSGFGLYVHTITGVHTDEENILLRERATDLNIRLMHRHLYKRIELPAFTDHSCMADSDDSVVINPQGGLSKCEHYIFEKVFGSVFCPERDEVLLHEWKESVLFHNCRICPLYPRCVHLRWCDGGKFKCTDADAANQLRFTKESMIVLYKDWEHTRNTFRKHTEFLLPYDVEPASQDGETYARLRNRTDKEQELIVPANDTSYDILTYIQEQRSFHEIVDMLNDKYDTGSYPLEDIVEDYLLQLLDRGLCKQSTQLCENNNESYIL